MRGEIRHTPHLSTLTAKPILGMSADANLSTLSSWMHTHSERKSLAWRYSPISRQSSK